MDSGCLYPQGPIPRSLNATPDLSLVLFSPELAAWILCNTAWNSQSLGRVMQCHAKNFGSLDSLRRPLYPLSWGTMPSALDGHLCKLVKQRRSKKIVEKVGNEVSRVYPCICFYHAVRLSRPKLFGLQNPRRRSREWRKHRSQQLDSMYSRNRQCRAPAPCSDVVYPLVNVYIAMERSTIFNGKIHYKYL